MSYTIWKTALAPVSEQEIEVPKGAVILSAREQGDFISVWYQCDSANPKEKRTIRVYGTGHDAPPYGNSWRFLGTASLDGGALMFHVFERNG